MAVSKNRRKSPGSAPTDYNQHPGRSLGFGKDRGRKVLRDAKRQILLRSVSNSEGATE